MAIPDFQSLMLPLLRVAADGGEHSLAEAREKLATEFNLTESDREEPLPSGNDTKFSNRVGWAKAYLQQAGLLMSPRRGYFQASPRGIDLLKSPPPRINIPFLERYPEFAAFRTPKSGIQKPPDASVETQEPVSPEEALHAAYEKMTASLTAELLSQVKDASPKFFERLVVQLLLKMGYGDYRQDAGAATGKPGDEGIDGIINEDRLGLDVLYIQAKKWNGTVGRPDIHRFVGALQGRQAKKGVFITTGGFSDEAVAYAKHIDPRVVLIDGHRLAELMIEFEIGVTTDRTYQVKRISTEYFDPGNV